MNLEINYPDAVTCVKIFLNKKLNIAREKFNKDKNQLNKIEYLELIDDMRRLNLLDREIVEKYLKQ